MKNHIAITFVLIAISAVTRAAEVEARLIRFTGELPPAADIIRLADAGLLPSIRSCIAQIDSEGAFVHSVTQPVPFASAFDQHGKPIKTDTCYTGLSFTGRATLAKDTYLLDVQFNTTELQSIRITHAENGTAIPQPVFHTQKITTSLETVPSSWKAITLAAPKKDNSRLVLLVTLRK